MTAMTKTSWVRVEQIPGEKMKYSRKHVSEFWPDCHELEDSSLSLLPCPCSLAGTQSCSSGAGTRAAAGGLDEVVVPKAGQNSHGQMTSLPSL